MSDKKVFKIEIDGVEKSYNDVIKLSEALNAINSVNATVATSNREVAQSQQEVSKAQSDYEKIQQRIAELEKESTRINIEANQQLRERRSEITAQVTANTAAEGSVKQMQAQLKLLRSQWDNLSVSERENEDISGELLSQIQELDSAIKEAKESTGRFQESVGNYSIAGKAMKEELAGIEDQLASMLANGVSPSDEAFRELAERAGEIKQSIQDAGKSIDSFASHSTGLNSIVASGQALTGAFGTATGVMAMFGDKNKEVEEQMKKLQGVMATLQSLQALQNTLTEKGTIVNTLYTKALQLLGIAKKTNVADTTALTAAQNASTVATTAGSTAMKVFRMALISTGVGALVVGLGMLITHFDDIKKWVVDLVPALGDMGGKFDEIKAIAAGLGNVLITYILTPFRVIGTVIKKLIEGDIKGALVGTKDEIAKNLEVTKNFQEGYEKQVIKNQENAAKEKAKLREKELKEQLANLESQYGSDYKFTEEGRKLWAEYYAAKKGMYDADSDEYKKAVNEELAFTRDVTKHDKDELKKRTDAAKQAADKRKQILEDYKKSIESFQKETHQLEIENEKTRIDTAKSSAEKMVAVTKDELKKRNDAIAEAYDKQQVLQQKLNLDEVANVEKQYNELLDKAKKAKQSKEELDKIEEEKQNRLSELRTKFTLAEIALNEEKNNKIKSSNKSFDDAEKKRVEDAKKLAKEKLDSETKLVDAQLRTIKELKDNAVARSGGLNLIDIDQTRKNLKDVENELKKYKSSLEKFKDEIEKNTTLDPEIKAKALDDINAKIKVTNKDIADNTQQQTQVMSDYWKDFSDKVGGYISVVSDSIGSIFETVGSFFDMKLEEAQEKLDEITEKYDEVVELQQESNERLAALNEEAKTAAGGRALVIQDEIQREMAYNKELAQQEKQLAKEKEKREKEAAKIEKQQKKAELAGNIVSGISGTALAVINALTVKPFPLGVALAAVAGAMGAVQVGIMSSQLSKLEKGGLINGKRHSEGGVPIGNTGIEVEGGEYVTNRKTTSKNLGLLSYINSQDKELGIGDFVNYYDDNTGRIVPNSSFKRMFEDGGQMDISNISSPSSSNDAILNAINSINFSPVVAVTDIIDATEQVTSVRDSAGFS